MSRFFFLLFALNFFLCQHLSTERFVKIWFQFLEFTAVVDVVAVVDDVVYGFDMFVVFFRCLGSYCYCCCCCCFCCYFITSLNVVVVVTCSDLKDKLNVVAQQETVIGW